MVIISKVALREFAAVYRDAETPLYNWYNQCAEADWKNFNELKTSFRSVDAVGNDRYVFNIKGNTYRLIALILFRVRTIFILFIGTHKEYDKIIASEIEYKR